MHLAKQHEQAKRQMSKPGQVRVLEEDVNRQI
jgi:hypothetical protein